MHDESSAPDDESPREHKMRLRRMQEQRWRSRHPEYFKSKGARASARRKLKVLTAYGGACACCGETEPVFLAIDHIGGGGRGHRDALSRRGATFYRWLMANKFPDGFRVLCHNCNFAVSHGRDCPHRIGPSLPATEMPPQFGGTHWHAALTEDEVRQIISRHALGGITQRQLAREYGVGESQVSRIILGQSWAYLPRGSGGTGR